MDQVIIHISAAFDGVDRECAGEPERYFLLSDLERAGESSAGFFVPPGGGQAGEAEHDCQEPAKCVIYISNNYQCSNSIVRKEQMIEYSQIIEHKKDCDTIPEPAAHRVTRVLRCIANCGHVSIGAR